MEKGSLLQTEKTLWTGNTLWCAGFNDTCWLTLGCYLDAKVKAYGLDFSGRIMLMRAAGTRP
ncbi:hypothetical protein YWY31_50360 [Paenibacillus illinoisensis]